MNQSERSKSKYWCPMTKKGLDERLLKNNLSHITVFGLERLRVGSLKRRFINSLIEIKPNLFGKFMCIFV